MSFLEKWEADIWPVVQKKYETLLQRPAKQDSAIGTHYEVKKMYEILMSKKEVHNVTCNLTWTEPVENTVLQSNISMVTVERFTLDMYVDMTAVASAVKVAGSAASVAGSAAAESAVAGSAAMSGGDNVGEGICPGSPPVIMDGHARSPHTSVGVMRSSRSCRHHGRATQMEISSLWA